MSNRSVRVLAAAAHAIGAGRAVIIDTLGALQFTMSVWWDGVNTAGVIAFEGTNVDPAPDLAADDEKWVALGTALTFQSNASNELSAQKAFRYIRARVTTAVVGGTAEVYIATAGFAAGGWN